MNLRGTAVVITSLMDHNEAVERSPKDLPRRRKPTDIITGEMRKAVMMMTSDRLKSL